MLSYNRAPMNKNDKMSTVRKFVVSTNVHSLHNCQKFENTVQIYIIDLNQRRVRRIYIQSLLKDK